MTHRRLLIPVFALAVFAAACSKDPPPPVEPTGPTAEQLEQMRQDSIRAAQAEEERMRREQAAAEAAARREAEQRMAAARTTLEEMIFFGYDESTLTSEAERILRGKLDILRNSPNVMIRVEGHADERGSTEYNIALGNRRAEAVRAFFVSFGLDEGRFQIRSYGEERPLNSASTEAAWSRNRRAEFVITAGANQINPGM